jgi:two-component system sensor histidine kinase HydH
MSSIRPRDTSPSFRQKTWRPAALAAFIVLVSILRYITGPGPSFAHELTLRLYFVPILVSAYWYGVTGGLIVAVIASIAYVNRVAGLAETLDPARLAEVVIFQLTAVVVGVLANAQRRSTARYRQAAATLEEANSRLRESHEQIRRIDRLKTLGEVASGLAHEIRHPLASIGGALEIIEARAAPDTPEVEFSRLAMAEVQRLDGLVWEFLRYARPHEPELRMTPLHDIMAQAITLLRVEADRKGVTLVQEEPGAAIEALVDALQIEQVLLNVILNAIQVTPAGARVLVGARHSNGDVQIDVVDEGAGIAPEHLPHLFSPFFTTREKGTGLGLAIAQRIVMSHDGRLEVVRTSSRGTCFRITLKGGARPAPRALPAGVA